MDYRLTLAIFLMLINLPTYALFSELNPNDVDEGDRITRLAEVFMAATYPQMKMSYELSSSCEYKVESLVTLPSFGRSPQDIIHSLVDSHTHLQSSNPEILKGYNIEFKDKDNFIQSTLVSKTGIEVKVINQCSFKNKKSSYRCEVDVGKTESTGIFKFRPFIFNHLSVSCYRSNNDLLKCSFKTKGKASSVLHRSSCSLAAGGATETFESIYRLTHYLTHGNVNDISRGKNKIDQFYKSAYGEYKSSRYPVEIIISTD
jgi:hypothetical protein